MTAVRRKRGRPPLEAGTPTRQWTLKLPQTLLDQVCICALERGVDVNRYVRDTLEREIAANKVHQKSAIFRSGRY